MALCVYKFTSISPFFQLLIGIDHPRPIFSLITMHARFLNIFRLINVSTFGRIYNIIMTEIQLIIFGWNVSCLFHLLGWDFWISSQQYYYTFLIKYFSTKIRCGLNILCVLSGRNPTGGRDNGNCAPVFGCNNWPSFAALPAISYVNKIKKNVDSDKCYFKTVKTHLQFKKTILGGVKFATVQSLEVTVSNSWITSVAFKTHDNKFELE